MADLSTIGKDALRNIAQGARDSTMGIINAGQEEATNFINERLSKMSEMVHRSEKGSGGNAGDGFKGIDEEEILSFVPDGRSIAGVAPLLLGIFLMVVLPGSWKFLAIFSFVAALISMFFGYIWQSKVDIAEGFEGVTCTKGEPDKTATSRTGRNWELNFFRFIPFRVATKRDQVVTINVANFTRDFASVMLRMQIVFRVTDSSKFVVNTSPALAMKLMQVYARYLALRMITSIVDARVKFTGRDDLKNVADELNHHLHNYGITVLRVTMPEAENGILEDLEQIRISVNETDTLRNTKAVRLEAGVKAVESEMRKDRKNALALSQSLQNEVISFISAVAVSVNAKRQELVIGAQREVTERYAKLRGEISQLVAKIAKATAIKSSIPSLRQDFALRLAEIKRGVALKMLPKHVSVLNVPGIGTGVGLSSGNNLLSKTLSVASSK